MAPAKGKRSLRYRRVSGHYVEDKVDAAIEELVGGLLGLEESQESLELGQDPFETGVKRMLDKLEMVKLKVNKENQQSENKDQAAWTNLENFYNLSVQITGFFYAPFFYWVIWFFYDETKISSNWGIRR